MIQIDISKLVLARANDGLSIEELSQKSGVGRSTIMRIESGKVEPRLATAGKIAKALGKTIEDFVRERGA